MKKEKCKFTDNLKEKQKLTVIEDNISIYEIINVTVSCGCPAVEINTVIIL